MPVHPHQKLEADGARHFCWTRRARGEWAWLDAVEVPLVEESEQYLVGLGPETAPHASWSVDAPEFVLGETERDGLIAQFGPADLWVSQIGTYARSAALRLATIA